MLGYALHMAPVALPEAVAAGFAESRGHGHAGRWAVLLKREQPPISLAHDAALVQVLDRQHHLGEENHHRDQAQYFLGEGFDVRARLIDKSCR